MKTRFTKNTLAFAITLLSALLLGTTLSAQTPFYSEDFSGGVPSGWTTTDLSGNNRLFTWCSDPTSGDQPPAGATIGCHRVWSDGTNNQLPFAAETAVNGFMTCDSDIAGSVTHNTLLTSAAIDATGQPTVIARMQMQIGVFTLDAIDNAILQVSIDGGSNWDDYTLFSCLIAGASNPPCERWSKNPEIVEVDISATAGNQDAVILRWNWTAEYEYHWNIDDVVLQDAFTPPPVNETALGSGWHAPSWATPAMHITPIDFAGSVSNNGGADQTGVSLRAVVMDSGANTVFDDNETIDVLPTGFIDSFLVIGTQFTPPAMPEQYTVAYTLTTDSLEEDAADNSLNSDFIITNNLFSKDNTQIISGSANELGGTYEFGNFYELTQADSAVSIIFGIGKNAADGPIDGESVTLLLLRVDCDLNDPACTAAFDDGSVTPVGVGFYTFPDEDPDIEDYTETEVDLLDFNTFAPGPLPLDAGVYVAFVSIVGNGVDNTIFVGTSDPGYAPGQLASVVREGGPIGGPGDGDWFLAGFGPETIAFTRLRVVGDPDPVGILEPEELAAEMALFPNPTSDFISLELTLEETAQRAIISILDVKGRTLFSEIKENFRTGTMTYDVNDFASGVYYLSVSTENGVKTTRFNVTH